MNFKRSSHDAAVVGIPRCVRAKIDWHGVFRLRSDRCAIGDFAEDDRGSTTKGGLWADLTCKT